MASASSGHRRCKCELSDLSDIERDTIKGFHEIIYRLGAAVVVTHALNVLQANRRRAPIHFDPDCDHSELQRTTGATGTCYWPSRQPPRGVSVGYAAPRKSRAKPRPRKPLIRPTGRAYGQAMLVAVAEFNAWDTPTRDRKPVPEPV